MGRARWCILLAVVAGLGVVSVMAVRKPAPTDGRPRILVQAFRTAESFSLPENRQPGSDSRSVALGKSYLTGRLVRPGRPFAVADDEKAATHDLIPVISFLRSRENVFKGATYGVETKTTKWVLDVMLSLKDRSTGEIVWAKTVSGSCDEQRPISASQFDNNIFHSLMISATEEAADALVDFFEPQEGESAPIAAAPEPASSVAPVSSAALAPAKPAATAKPSLAILRPDFRDGVTENEAVVLWGYLESSVDGSAYRVISRADVSRMMEEVAITTSSYLTDPTCREKARVGKLATVSKLLATSVGRIGGKYVMTFKVFDASTGEIDSSRMDNATADTIEGLLSAVGEKTAKVLSPVPSLVILAPVSVRIANPPNYLATEFNARLETVLSQSGIAYKPGAAGSRMMVPAITEFSIRAVSDGDGFVYRGSMAFSISNTGAAGNATAAPTVVTLSDVELGRETGIATPGLTARYGRKLIEVGMKKVSFVKQER